MDADIVPRVKRRRIDDHNYSVGDCVLRRNREILESLDVGEILKSMLTPVLTFLTPKDENELHGLQDTKKPEGMIIQRMLFFLRAHPEEIRDEAFRKFVACIRVSADEAHGHRDLVKIFQHKLPDQEWQLIEDLVKEVIDSPLPSPYRTPQQTPLTASHTYNAPALINAHSPERPFPRIALQGQLAEREGFVTIERDLWWSFSTGKYHRLEQTVAGIQRDDSFRVEIDCQVVAMWFDSLITMHRDGEYSRAIGKLYDALELCKQKNCVNGTILEGRIHQRIAQNCLMKGLKEEATMHFQMAKEKLQMVERGYDKTNMFCREAKILSATEPHRRADIEKTYDLALSTLEKDDSYFLASFPSVTLSKTAFHLRVAFGSQANRDSNLPQVCASDIAKAEETLHTIEEEEHIKIEMRQFEYDFLRAELCRLQGDERSAREKFAKLTHTSGSEKVKNIVSLAEHRLQQMQT